LFFEGLSYLGSVSRGWHDSLSEPMWSKEEVSKQTVLIIEEFGRIE
jgi:hypothetical protein